MKDATLPHETCSLCRNIPDSQHQDGIKDGDVGIPPTMETFSGWHGQSLRSGYRAFTVTCRKCRTDYLVEVDVEPFVWDVDITRLAGVYKDYKGYYA